MVYVSCMTYNHALYIKDALDGFCMQQTNFPYVCVIVDDYSTDGEIDILQQYLQDNFKLEDKNIASKEETDDYVKVFARHNTNVNCHFAVFFLKYNHYRAKKRKAPYVSPYRNVSKYYSICEGDDYWITPNKLQKQYDFLETHPDCSLCGTNGQVEWTNGSKKSNLFNYYKHNHFVSPEEVIGEWLFPTASLFFRIGILFQREELGINMYGGDQTLILLSLSMGNIYAFTDITCVYRRDLENKNSATNMAKKKGREYITEQHIKMYTWYDEYTNGRYSYIIKPLLTKLKKRLPVYKKMNNSYVQAFFENPIVFLTIALNKIKIR